MKRIWLGVILGCLWVSTALAQDKPAAPKPEDLKAAVDLVQVHANYVWTLVCTALVFFMQAGFAMVETGFTRAKNAVNVLMKGVMDFCVGSVGFWAVGFGLMFGATAGGWFGTTGFFLSDWKAGGDPWVLAFWMFQVVFCATSATIVAGAMAERVKFSAYLICSLVVSAIIYPIYGSWVWGGLFKGKGWLESLGFIDFAGSSVVHSIGGWIGLAGTLVLGPRLGKYGKDGKPRAILGHSMPLAALGVFILWLGWFGFNPGSTTTANKDIAWIFVNTNLAAAAGGLLAMFTSWLKFGKPDISMSLNGCLAGLVAVTAPCNTISPTSAIIIGAIAGVLVVYSVLFFDRRGVDDPVGAVSVHAVCGTWGTIAVALFHTDGFTIQRLGVQVLGSATAFVWAFGTALIMFKILKATMGLRVSENVEMEGLDPSEHGQTAYPDFQVSAYVQE